MQRARFELISRPSAEVVDAQGASSYTVRIYGNPGEGGRWHGWIAFFSKSSSEVLVTEQETSQPNRRALAYWASGLTDTYLEGALERARRLAPEHVLDQLRRELEEAAREAAREAKLMRAAAEAQEKVAKAGLVRRRARYRARRGT